jgi:predicted nucleotidyltransferase
VAFAFLFGSQARGSAHSLSDVDIAVYFRPRARHPLERETEVFYLAEGEIWADLERVLQREVEMLVLNRAPASVAFSAIGGIPLAVNDVRLYLDFSEVVSFEAIDFREMLIRDFLEKMKPQMTQFTRIAAGRGQEAEGKLVEHRRSICVHRRASAAK